MLHNPLKWKSKLRDRCIPWGISRARPANDDALLSEAALPEDWSNSGVGKRGYGCCGLGPGWRESL